MAEEQPRDERGRFAGGGGAGLASWVQKQVEEKGGATYRPSGKLSGRTPKDGIMVSRDPKEGHGHVVEVSEIARTATSRDAAKAQVKEAVGKWLDAASAKLGKLGDDHYLGVWGEKDKGGAVIAIHLDISQRFGDEASAVKAGRERNQVSVWHVSEKREIPTGGTGR